jgi:hypothetical protein
MKTVEPFSHISYDSENETSVIVDCDYIKDAETVLPAAKVVGVIADNNEKPNPYVEIIDDEEFEHMIITSSDGSELNYWRHQKYSIKCLLSLLCLALIFYICGKYVDIDTKSPRG